MHHQSVLTAGLVALAALPGAFAGIYTKSSPVLQVDQKSYDRLIAKSNHTSIVEFYAPWCGHCQNLKPAYEKAAKSLDGLANVAAVDCDEESNKPLCAQFGIQGFPTLKIVRPGSKPGKPVVEDYQGPRTASGIVDAVIDKINNHVKRVTDKDLDTFLADGPETPKALLFTDKGTTSSLLKSIAIEFLDVVTIAMVRDTQKKVVEKYSVTEFPKLILLPPGGANPIVYDGELKKGAMVSFISQLGEPNPDPSAKAQKKSKPADTPREEEPAPEAATEQESEKPVAPPVARAAPAIPSIDSLEKLQQECLNSKSHICVLALVPAEANEDAENSLTSLAEVAQKQKGQHKLFPFFAVPEANPGASSLREALDLKSPVELVAVNGRRGWWKHYGGASDLASVEAWIDAIRMSEGAKQKFPAGFVVAPEDIKEEAKPEESEVPVQDEPEAKSREHEEL